MQDKRTRAASSRHKALAIVQHCQRKGNNHTDTQLQGDAARLQPSLNANCNKSTIESASIIDGTTGRDQLVTLHSCAQNPKVGRQKNDTCIPIIEAANCAGPTTHPITSDQHLLAKLSLHFTPCITRMAARNNQPQHDWCNAALRLLQHM